MEGGALSGEGRPPEGPYETLRVAPGASAPELRAAYLRAARAAHPDRGGGAGAGPFLAVQAAWATLGDPRRRAAYDRERAAAEVRRRAAEEGRTLYDAVGLDELELEPGAGEGAGEYTYECRCGDLYRVAAADIRGAGADVLLPCGSCSLYLRVEVRGGRRTGPAEGRAGRADASAALGRKERGGVAGSAE